MIKIVVRHHSHQRQHHSDQRPSQEAAPELAREHNTSNRKRLNQGAGAATSKRQSTMNNQTSSCVEIEYSKMSTSSAGPKAAIRSVNKSGPVAVSRQKVPAGTKSVQARPRGSLSSCSSSSPELSGNEEAEYYCSYHPEERRSFNYSLSVFDESSSDELDEKPVDLNNNDQEAVGAKQPPASVLAPVAPRRAPHIHHSRSISLMVNPNFDSSSGEESEPPASAQASAAGSAKYKRGRNRFHYRQVSHCPVVQREFREADFLRLKQLKEELEASKLTEAESARLREIGFFLRQISDEFALDRRLTI